MKNRDYIRQDGESNGIDFDAHYRIEGWPAIAVYLLSWKAQYVPIMCYMDGDDGEEIEVESGEFELEPDFDTVIAVMVGDDRRHEIDISRLIPIKEDEFCRDCGQIGCRCNVYV